MQCTTANKYKADGTEVYGDYMAERSALGFAYFSNYTQARQLVQDQIITSIIGEKKERVQRTYWELRPLCTFMMGTPGSGKSTEAARICDALTVVIDADQFKEALPEFREFPRRIASGVVHHEAALLAAIMQRRVEPLGWDIIVDNACANLKWLETEIARLRDHFRLELVRTVLEKSQCRARCQARGRHVPGFVIDQIYDQVNTSFLKVHDSFSRVRVVHT